MRARDPLNTKNVPILSGDGMLFPRVPPTLYYLKRVHVYFWIGVRREERGGGEEEEKPKQTQHRCTGSTTKPKLPE
jgi:hypothetical protein